jgi:hypothetical protein
VELTGQLEVIMSNKPNKNEIRSIARREILPQLAVRYREI